MAKLRKFDVIICSGLFYHLAADELIPLLKNISSKLKNNGLLILDTNIAYAPVESVDVKIQFSKDIHG